MEKESLFWFEIGDICSPDGTYFFLDLLLYEKFLNQIDYDTY